jgi:hypothetical protein
MGAQQKGFEKKKEVEEPVGSIASWKKKLEKKI